MNRANSLRFVLAISASAMVAFQGLPMANAAGSTPPAALLVHKVSGKLTPRLQALAQSASLRAAGVQEQAVALSVAPDGALSLLRDQQGRLLVYIRTDDVSPTTVQAIRLAGAEIVHVSKQYSVVTAYVDPTALPALADSATIKSVQEVLAPDTAGPAGGRARVSPAAPAIGAQTSEGDSQLNAATARTTHGVNGAGVTVGVLSDSYNRESSIKTAAQDIASGDLPGPGNPNGFATAVNVIQEGAAGNSDEGRGMLQIVHDLAPGAGLAFATAFSGLFSFADNIRSLRNTAGAHIIVDNVSYSDEPFYQEGPVSVAISDVVGAGAQYYTSAGNSNAIVSANNASSYEAPAYRPITCPTGTPVYQLSCHDFDPGAGTDSGQDITLVNGGSIKLILQWAQPWYGVMTDLDVYVLNSSNAAVAGSEMTNSGATGTGEPFETFNFQNATGSTQTFRIVIARYTGTGGGDTGTPRLKYLFIRSSGISAVQYNTSSGGDVVGPTIFGHSSTRFGFSVAAAEFSNNTSPETFSSRGPATHYFAPVIGASPAAAVTPYAIQQPDFTATDGGCTTFFYQAAGGGCYRFYGTSAAAPHAAAVAALMKQKANQVGIGLTQSGAKAFLQSTARTMSGGNLNSAGAGLIDANAAVGRIALLTRRVFVPIIRR